DWMGVFLSVTCAEDVARIDARAIRVEGTYLGDDRLRQQREACAVWPRAELPADFWEPAVSPVPVFALSGWLDPVTPPEAAEEVLRGFPNHVHAVIRDGAHVRAGLNDMQCEFDMIARFVQSGSPHGLDTSCVSRMKRQPFVLKAD
ncbi:MAG: alpha/beta hydrolase, partial [Thermoanaerobaculia bacterium]